ncbi:S-layer homology domain-containing protein [Lentibacillus kimchii]|uniref:S-layer homology domain-containing protein n=1 Tax=Lentibacillus kimchii TaxID=1542911 RepID=A0ABW2UV11_9BACI
MSKKTKTFRNVAISTMAASATVAAVAPAAVSAEDVSFSDVTPEHTHYDNIIKMAEQGIIQGHPDGTFKPYNNIVRGQIAAMLTNALDLDTPDNMDEVLAQYDDVDGNSDYAPVIAAVTDANIFKGDHGHFGEFENITREQMATALVEAYDLNKYDNQGMNADLNREHISNSHVDNVQTLANLGITIELDNYRAYEQERRDQFATMIAKTEEVVSENAPGVENVETTVNDDNTFSISGSATGIADSAHLIVTDGDGKKVINNEDIDINKDDNSFSFTSDQLDAGNYSYTIMGMENGNHGSLKSESGKFEIEAPAVEDVSAVTSKTVDVTFNQLPDDVSKDDFEIENTDNQYDDVKIDSMSTEDGNINLALTSALSEDTDYELTYTGQDEDQTIDFTYEKATPTDINVTTETVAQGEDSVNLKSEVLADDQNVTEDFDVTYTSDSGDVEKDGSVDTSDMKDGDSFIVRAHVGSGDNAIESDKQVVTVEDSMADSYQFFTINDNGDVDEDLKTEDAKQTVNNNADTVGNYIVPHVNDQFGKAITDGNFKFESLNPETMLVDENSGEIKGVYDNGNAQVKVTAPGTNFEKVINVNVQEPAEVSDFELSDSSINTSNTADTQNVTVTVKDQYGNAVDEEDVTAETDSDSVSLNDGISTNEDGEATIEITPEEKGEATVDVKVGELDKQTITVNVTEAGDTDDYEIANTGDNLEYDKNADDDSLEFSVYGVDADGNHTDKDPENGVDFKVTNEDGEEIDTSNGETVKTYNVQSKVNSGNLEVGNYTLSASKNGFDYGSVDFKVVDSTPELNHVSFDSNSFKLEGQKQDLVDLLNDQGVTMTDQNGDVMMTEDSDGNDVKATLDEDDIESVDVSNDNILNHFVNDNDTNRIAGKGAGETIVNVKFNTGEDSTQTVAFSVKNTVDSANELEYAIDHTSDDAADTITLGGNIDLNSPLDLNSQVTLDGNGHSIDQEVKITSDNVTVKDLNLDVAEANAIDVAHGVTEANLENNVINNTGQMAIYFNKNSSGEVIGNEITDSRKGIGADTSENVTIKNNDITFSEVGIELFDGSGDHREAINNSTEESNFPQDNQYDVSGNEFEENTAK